MLSGFRTRVVQVETLETPLATKREIESILSFEGSRKNGVLKVVWYPIMHQKVCLNLVKKDQLCAIALMNRKGIFEDFTQNGC